MNKIQEIKNFVIEQVIWAENNLYEKSGKDKKAAVIKKLDELIKLPTYLEWIDDIVISYLVDQACEKLNALTAHSFKDIEFNSVDKARIAEGMEIKNVASDKEF